MAKTPTLVSKEPKKRGGVRGRANDIDVHVGSRIRLRRVLMGMTQEKLGGVLGLTFQQLQKYERGANRVSASKLFALSNALEVPVSFFFDDMGDGVKPAPAAQELVNRKALELQKAYGAIEDEDLRGTILDLVKSIGGRERAPLLLAA